MARIRSRVAGSFTVRPSDVQEVCTLLECAVDPPKISSECSDDIERDFSSFDELASYGNPLSRSITSLTISSSKSWKEQSDAPIERSSVSFHSNGIVSIDVEGEEREGVELRNKLWDIVDGTKNWYAFITKSLDSVAASVIIPFVWGITLLIFLQSVLANESTQSSKIEVSFPILILLVLVASIVFIGPVFVVPFALGKLQSWLFPGTYFALGQGKRRDRTKERIRWGFVVVVLSLVMSIVFFLFDKTT